MSSSPPAFLLQPSFELSADLSTEPVPSNVRASAAWRDVRSVGMYLSHLPRHIRYVAARHRCRHLPGLLLLAAAENKDSSSSPWLLPRIMHCEAMFLLGDHYGAQEELESLVALCATDEKLQRIRAEIRDAITWLEEQEETYERARRAQRFAAPDPFLYQPLYPAEPPASVAPVPVVPATYGGEQQQFIRLACATAVLCDEANPVPMLSAIRAGFSEDTLPPLERDRARSSRPSRQQGRGGGRIRSVVLKQLCDAEEAYALLLRNLSLGLSRDLILRVHGIMMRSREYEETHDRVDEEEYVHVRKLRVGKFRRATIYHARIAPEPDRTHFPQRFAPAWVALHQDIEREIDALCAYANCDDDDEDSCCYVRAAWLFWAFLRIRPFEKGNEEMARCIASVPLMRRYGCVLTVLPKDMPALRAHFAEATVASVRLGSVATVDHVRRMADFLRACADRASAFLADRASARDGR